MSTVSTTAIETEYQGVRFRSRLEARWAMVFDTLDIPWLYEPEAFTIHMFAEEVGYLPDFYFPRSQTWVEVKGSTHQLHADADKLMWACDWTPIPGLHESQGSEGRGLLILGPVPAVVDRQPVHPILQHHKGVWVYAARLDPGFGVLTDWDDSQIGWFGRESYGDASAGDGLHFGVRNQRLDIDTPWFIDQRAEKWVADAYNQARSHRFYK